MHRLMLFPAFLLPGAALAHEGDHGSSAPAHLLQSPDHAVVLLALIGAVALMLRGLSPR